MVSNNAKNIGVQIVSKIWSFNSNHPNPALSMGNAVASSFFTRTITAADTGSLISIPLDTGYSVLNGLDSGIYVVGWEVVNLPQGTTFEVMNDLSTAVQQPNASNFVWLGHSPGWAWTGDNPGIRLNFRSLFFTVGLEKYTEENNFDFNILPNPNSGLFKLNILSDLATSYTLTIISMLGQVIYTELISVNGELVKSMDLRNIESGVYFISLQSENESVVKKVIIK